MSPPIRRRELLATVGAAGATAIAGCIDGSAPEGTTTGTEPSDDASTDRESVVVAADSQAALGDVLVDGEGMTLYMFEPDEQGGDGSACTGGCAQAWPPLTVESEDGVEAGSDVTASLGTIEREDGSLQVTADGWPLYYFADDGAAGDANGQEVGNVWFVLRPDGSVLRPTASVREHEQLGEILTDALGMTLYMFESDEQGAGESTCTDGCAQAWPPLTVESADALVDSVRADVELSTFERGDGSLQVAADGWPLYYFADDDAPGDANGQGASDVWYVLRADGSVNRESA